MNNSSTSYNDVNVYYITKNLTMLSLLAVLATMLATFVVLSNVTIVAAMIVSRHSRSKHIDNNITQHLMASMACVDIFNGAFSIPLNVLQIVYNGKWKLSKDFCNLFNDINNASCSASACHILCMAVDKYMAVCKPLFYRVMTKRASYVMVILSWILPSTIFLLPPVTRWFGTREMANGDDEMLVCLPVFNNNILLALYSVGFYLPMISAYVLYAFIFSEIWKFNKRKYLHSENNVIRNNYLKGNNLSVINESNSVPLPSNQEPNSVCLSGSSTTKSEPRSKDLHVKEKGDSELSGRISRNMKAIRTLGTIIVCFSVFWTPVWISSALFVYTNHNMQFESIFTLGWFAYINSAVNPVLCMFFKPIRKAMRYLLCNVKYN